MPRCGATFDGNSVPSKGTSEGFRDRQPHPPRRCAPHLRRRGFSRELPQIASKRDDITLIRSLRTTACFEPSVVTRIYHSSSDTFVLSAMI